MSPSGIFSLATYIPFPLQNFPVLIYAVYGFGVFKLDCAESLNLSDYQARRAKDLPDDVAFQFPREEISLFLCEM